MNVHHIVKNGLLVVGLTVVTQGTAEQLTTHSETMANVATTEVRQEEAAPLATEAQAQPVVTTVTVEETVSVVVAKKEKSKDTVKEEVEK